MVCWTDDLLTVAKERAHGDVHNLVIVLEYATGCDERKAVDMVAQRIEARFADFGELRRRMLADTDTDTGTDGALRAPRGGAARLDARPPRMGAAHHPVQRGRGGFRRLSRRPPGLTMTDTVIVIGAGVAGLTAAYRLRTAGLRVTVLESAGQWAAGCRRSAGTATASTSARACCPRATGRCSPSSGRRAWPAR